MSSAGPAQLRPFASPPAGWVTPAGRQARLLVHLLAARTAESAVAVHVARLATRQAEAGLPVAIVARPTVVRRLPLGEEVLRAALPLRFPGDPLAVLRLRRTLAVWRVGAVQTHGLAALATARLALTGDLAVPILTFHRLAFHVGPLTSLWWRGRRVAGVVAACQAVAEVLSRAGRVVTKRTRVCWDGADLHWLEESKGQASLWRQRLGLDGAQPLVVHLGVRSWRGGADLLKAWPAVRRKLPQARLLLAGCHVSSDAAEVMDLAAEMGVAGSVTVSEAGHAVPALLAAADVVADASWAGAGVSMAVRDAMGLGRPVVAVARDGHWQLVRAGQTGLLVPPRDAPTLAAAVIRLATDATLASKVGEAGRAWVTQHCSLTGQVAELSNLYREIGVFG